MIEKFCSYDGKGKGGIHSIDVNLSNSATIIILEYTVGKRKCPRDKTKGSPQRKAPKICTFLTLILNKLMEAGGGGEYVEWQM